ncbi:MAG: transporter [Cyanobacteria bacterium RYN_339]|nr:transporter [Cyanobacteria bacterium RYN_339]
MSPALRQTLRLSVLEGCFALLPQTYTTGVFITGYLLLLHADPWAFGLLAAVPALGQAAQLAAAAVLAQGERRKAMCVWGASLSRYLWLPMALLPFAPLSDDAKLGLFFLLLATATALIQMSGVAWTSWMGDLVPAATRGRYFGFRNAVGAVVGMGAVWGGTAIMTAYKAAGQEARGFLVLIGLAVVASVASQLALHAQAAPPPAPKTTPPRLRHTFRAPWADRRFMRIVLGLGAWSFVANLTGPFCYAYAMADLHLSYATLGLHTMIVTAVGIGAQLAWGRAIDRWGAHKVLVGAMIPVCFHPLIWFFMHPGFTAPLWLDAVSTGVFWSGITLATLALLLERAPRGEQAPYVSLLNAFSGVATGLGSLAGGAFLAANGHTHFAYGLVAFQVLLLPTVALRLGCMLALARITAERPTLTLDVWAGAPVPVVEASISA